MKRVGVNLLNLTVGSQGWWERVLKCEIYFNTILYLLNTTFFLKSTLKTVPTNTSVSYGNISIAIDNISMWELNSVGHMKGNVLQLSYHIPSAAIPFLWTVSEELYISKQEVGIFISSGNKERSKGALHKIGPFLSLSLESPYPPACLLLGDIVDLHCWTLNQVKREDLLVWGQILPTWKMFF